MWIYDDDDEATIAAKKEKFEKSIFPITFIMSADGTADGSQYNEGEILAPPTQLTRDELFQKMINSGMNSILFDVERKVEEFRVKTPLYGTKPLRAKVGKKEGLKSEQRFFVYEFEQKRNGKTKANRKGVIRVKSAVDNRKVATGESQLYTTFYQTAGFGLMDGMFLQQRNDFGIGVSAGIAIGEIGGGFIKGEANLGLLAGRFLGTDIGATQLKLYAGIGFDADQYSLPSLPLGFGDGYGGTYDFSFTRFQVGLSKGWYFAHIFSFAPFVGYASESGTSNDWVDSNSDIEDGQMISTDFLHYGAYATMNISHWMQIVGAVNMYSVLGSAYDMDREEIDGSTYNEIFVDRSGMSLELGLRIEF
jgi:hypothetical protein